MHLYIYLRKISFAIEFIHHTNLRALKRLVSNIFLVTTAHGKVIPDRPFYPESRLAHSHVALSFFSFLFFSLSFLTDGYCPSKTNLTSSTAISVSEMCYFLVSSLHALLNNTSVLGPIKPALRSASVRQVTALGCGNAASMVVVLKRNRQYI